MKKLLIGLMICMFVFTAMAEITDNETTTLYLDIGEVLWLTIDNDVTDNRTWSISEADFRTEGTDTSGLGASPGNGINAELGIADSNMLGYADGEEGDPNSWACFATDGVDGKGSDNNIANGLRLAVDSNDADGYTLSLKADGATFGGTGDTIPVGQVAWWTHTGQYTSADTNPYGTASADGTGVGDWTTVGPDNITNVLTTSGDDIFSTDGEGANVTTLNLGLTLYTTDAFTSDYSQTITVTAVNN
ncbi:hypothetical protein ACFL57_00585 [Candidatus Margulisiibacteriota bacterium]